jgi:hypothetical protein
VTNIRELIRASNDLLAASNEMQSQGGKNPAAIPYYLSFNINPNTFFMKLSEKRIKKTLLPLRKYVKKKKMQKKIPKDYILAWVNPKML